MLPKAPFDDLKAYLDRWAEECMSCAPADRPLAEEGIRHAYAAAGLAPPDRMGRRCDEGHEYSRRESVHHEGVSAGLDVRRMNERIPRRQEQAAKLLELRPAKLTLISRAD